MVWKARRFDAGSTGLPTTDKGVKGGPTSEPAPMTGTTLSSNGLDPRRKRILFRAWHRGTREMDLLLGQFADAALPGMSADDLDAFEGLMEVPDQDLFAWVTGKVPIPGNYDTQILRRVMDFHLGAGQN